MRKILLEIVKIQLDKENQMSSIVKINEKEKKIFNNFQFKIL